jgi:hypothetical protein
MNDSVLRFKKVISSLPTITRYILIASFAAILIGCAYYIYKLYRQERDINLPLNLIQNINRFEEDFLNNSHITDVKNNWDTSLSDLRTQYIRDKKLNEILN